MRPELGTFDRLYEHLQDGYRRVYRLTQQSPNNWLVWEESTGDWLAVCPSRESAKEWIGLAKELEKSLRTLRAMDDEDIENGKYDWDDCVRSARRFDKMADKFDKNSEKLVKAAAPV